MARFCGPKSYGTPTRHRARPRLRAALSNLGFCGFFARFFPRAAPIAAAPELWRARAAGGLVAHPPRVTLRTRGRSGALATAGAPRLWCTDGTCPIKILGTRICLIPRAPHCERARPLGARVRRAVWLPTRPESFAGRAVGGMPGLSRGRPDCGACGEIYVDSHSFVVCFSSSVRCAFEV